MKREDLDPKLDREAFWAGYREGYREGQRHPVVRINEDGQPAAAVATNLPPQTDYKGLVP